MIDYNVFCEIMGDSIADGRESFAANDQFQPQEPPLPNIELRHEDEVQSGPLQDDGGDEHISTSRVHNSNPVSTPIAFARGIKRRRPVREVACDPLARMVDAFENLAETQRMILKEGTMMGRMRSCMEALEAIELDDELKYRAIDLLQGEIKGSTFLALPPGMRRKWLLRVLGCS